MYVVPTPFRLIDGAAHQQSLILPAGVEPGDRFFRVGELCRREASQLIVAYSFDLRTNAIRPKTVPNPAAGCEHVFCAWRLKGSPAAPVTMRELDARGDA